MIAPERYSMKPNLEGQSVPEVLFHLRDETAWKKVSTRDLFAGRTVVAFALPGAFTPTCSSRHVPRFQELADSFAKLGVDQIVCLAVNDAFVMDAFREAEGATRILFVGDGNGDFARAMGMLVDDSAIGFGKRSRRYSMLVRDGVITKMFVEQEGPGDPFAVSDADTMLHHLGGVAPNDVLMFTRKGCSHCLRARQALAAAGLPFAELPTSPRILRALPGERTTPQVFVDGKHIGGADELVAWLAARPNASQA